VAQRPREEHWFQGVNYGVWLRGKQGAKQGPDGGPEVGHDTIRDWAVLVASCGIDE